MSAFDKAYFGSEAWFADEFAARFGNAFRCVSGTWYAWDGKRWTTELAEEKALEAVLKIARDVGKEAFDDDNAAMVEAARRILKANAARAVRSLAAAKEPVRALASDFDSESGILAVQNGLVDLASCELYPHTPEAMCTKLGGCDYDPAAKAPQWERFLDRIFAGDAELIAFVQRAVGYSLTAEVEAQAWFFCHGSGANGKSVFLETVEVLLGGHGTKLHRSAVLAAEHGETAASMTALADVRGARFAYLAELPKTARWDDERIKAIAGDGSLKSKRMGRDFEEFQSTAKLWVASNHAPATDDTSHGFWRRVRLVPFEVTIPEGERDTNLAAKLRAELPGILNWALQGLSAYREQGLAAPAKVNEATSAYQAEEDTVAAWVSVSLDDAPGGYVASKELHAGYVRWCDASGIKALVKKAFDRELTGKLEAAFGPDPKGRKSTRKGVEGRRVTFKPDAMTPLGYQRPTPANQPS